jgi:thioredoxin reductase
MSKENLKVVILGGGESGVGAAILAKTKGLEVFLSDKGEIKENYKKILEENAIEFEEKTTMKKGFWQQIGLSNLLVFLRKLK